MIKCNRKDQKYGGLMGGFIGVLLMLFCILGGASGYVAYRAFRGISSFLPCVRFLPVLTVFLVMALVMVLGFGRSMLSFSSSIKHILGVISAYYMGIFLVLLAITAAVDILTVLPKILKAPFTSRHFFDGICTVCVFALTGIICAYGFIHAHGVEHISYNVSIEGKTDVSDMNIVMISDLHLGAVGSESRLPAIVDEINALNPDIVCIAGDFFDTDYTAIQDPDRAIEILKGLKASYGVYACFGNHDAGDTVGDMESFLQKAGVRLLKEEYAVIDDRLVLAGRLDPSPIGGYGTQKRGALSDFLNIDNEKMPVIVLDHNPAKISEYGKEADLIMCGHTHKGQIFPASLITDAIYDVDYGYYRKNSESPHVIVTSGVGFWGMPMRIGTNCEIVTIQLLNN